MICKETMLSLQYNLKVKYMARKKLIREETYDAVDITTGEVIKTTSMKTFIKKVEGQEYYVQQYASFIGFLCDVNSLVEIHLIGYLLQFMEWNTGCVSLSTAKRKMICEKMNIKNSNFSKAIKNLKDKNIISGQDGEYVFNPEFVWKGDNETRNKLLNETCQMSYSIQIEKQ